SGQPPSSGRTVTKTPPSTSLRCTVAMRGGKRWHSPRLVISLSQLSQKRHPLHWSMVHLETAAHLDGPHTAARSLRYRNDPAPTSTGSGRLRRRPARVTLGAPSGCSP